MVFSVGGATFVSLLGIILPVHLTVINYKIFGNTPGKKRVCFEFAKRGTCERLKTQGHCPYSHDDEDCAKFRAAKLLGKGTIENIAKEIKNRGPQGKPYEKAHTDTSPRASSPGARPILQRQPGAGGSARRS